MKKTLLFLTALLAAALACNAQTAREAIAANRDLAGGIYYVDDFSVREAAPAPRGYKPFYISHYGRHGARNHGSNEEFDKLLEVLKYAEAGDNLTPLGKDLLEQYSEAWPLLHLRGNDLTDLGWDQHRGIAGRMAADYPSVFKGKGRKVVAYSTVVPRCIMSMAAFCESLLEFNPRLDISTGASAAYMGELNPFTMYNPQVKPTDAGYDNKNAAWRTALNDFSKRTVDPAPLAARLLRDPSKLPAGVDAVHLMRYLYHVAATVQDGGFGGDYWKYFTLDEAYAKFQEFNLKMYLSKGPDTIIQGGRQWAFVNYFVQKLLDDAEADMAAGDVAARLRFGHDITIISALTLLDVDGWNKSARNFDDVADLWQHYRIPMASNLQFVFYRNGKGDVLVRVMLNERDIRFPIQSDLAPYYRWSDFKAFATGRIDHAKHIIATTKAPVKRKK